jgi:hypothetical protein
MLPTSRSAQYILDLKEFASVQFEPVTSTEAMLKRF